jgi:DNA-binding NtrC family response regulator
MAMPKIMVIDDEVELHEFYTGALSKMAGKEIACVERLPKIEDKPKVDCFVVDFSMPGSTFEDALRFVGEDPMILVTGHLERIFEFQVLKPFTAQDLQKQVQAALNSRLTQPPAAVKVGDIVEFNLSGKLHKQKVLEIISPEFVKVDMRFQPLYLRTRAISKAK